MVFYGYWKGRDERAGGKIDYGTGADQKIHPQNTVDLKAIVHAADFDFKIRQTKIVARYKINTSFTDNLSAADASYDMKCILGRRHYLYGFNKDRFMFPNIVGEAVDFQR